MAKKRDLKSFDKIIKEKKSSCAKIKVNLAPREKGGSSESTDLSENHPTLQPKVNEVVRVNLIQKSLAKTSVKVAQRLWQPKLTSEPKQSKEPQKIKEISKVKEISPKKEDKDEGKIEDHKKEEKKGRKLADRQFDPVDDGMMLKGEEMKIAVLAQAVEEIENNSQGQDGVKEILANLFRIAIVNNPDELKMLFYLVNWRLGPEYEGVEMGIGNEQLVQAISKAWATTPKTVKDTLKRVGDLGNVTMELKGSMKNLQSFFNAKANDIKPLTVTRWDLHI